MELYKPLEWRLRASHLDIFILFYPLTSWQQIALSSACSSSLFLPCSCKEDIYGWVFLTTVRMDCCQSYGESGTLLAMTTGRVVCIWILVLVYLGSEVLPALQGHWVMFGPSLFVLTEIGLSLARVIMGHSFWCRSSPQREGVGIGHRRLLSLLTDFRLYQALMTIACCRVWY
jgi:hypothetical protein